MPWLLGFLGFALGFSLDSFNSGVLAAAMGAVAGFWLKHRNDPAQQLQERTNTEHDVAVSTSDPADPLNVRVTQLEARVAHLEAALRASDREVPIPEPIAQTKAPIGTTAIDSLGAIHPQEAMTAQSETASHVLPKAEAPGVQRVHVRQETLTESTLPEMQSEPKHEALPESATPSVLRNLLFGGNTIVRVGIVVLFFGLAFLAKYAVDAGLFPIEFRLAGIAVAAIALLATGWRLRERNPGYALAMQGGGVAVLYLTIYAAFRLYGLLPPIVAFALLIIVAAFGALMAVKQNALQLAVISTVGGFVAPILVSTGAGNHVLLFSYYVILNLGVLAIAFKKSWRALEGIAFALTWGIMMLWVVDKYQPALYASTQPFVAAFFVIFLTMSLFVVRRANAVPTQDTSQLNAAINGALTFGVPVVAMAVQSIIVRHIEFGTAFSAVVFGAVYLAFGLWLKGRGHRDDSLLLQIFLAIGVAFATLAIPLAFDARVTAGAWALEGAALFWLGRKQASDRVQLAGLGLQLAAGAAFVYAMSKPEMQHAFGWPVLNARTIGALLIACAGFASARWVSIAAIHTQEMREGHATRQDGNTTSTIESAPRLATACALWALAWTAGAGSLELDRVNEFALSAQAHLLLATGIALVAQWLGMRWRLPIVQAVALGLIVPMIAVAALTMIDLHGHPLARSGWLVWPIAFVAFERLLARPSEVVASGVVAALHMARATVFIVLITAEAMYGVGRIANDTWQFAASIAVPALSLLAVHVLARTERSAQFMQWTTARTTYSKAYLPVAATVVLCVVVVVTFGLSGEPAPLPFIPLVNPLDLAGVLAWILALRVWRDSGLESTLGTFAFDVRAVVLLLLAFALGNVMLLRALHHLAGVPYAWTSVLTVPRAQMMFSIAWALVGIACMLWAQRRTSRVAWGIGAALLAVVVVKLFFVDLSSAKGIERIVSFVVVGVLLLGVGYFAPVPPAAKVRET